MDKEKSEKGYRKNEYKSKILKTIEGELKLDIPKGRETNQLF
ncbi:MAG: hypothetical protein QXW01_03515 [Candidatus Aenigmatarchaeota archaeon]